MGNSVIYVDQDNNIYHRASVKDQDEPLTTSGIESEVFNGIPDWVFEEEVFEDNKAMWWAPDGNKLVWRFFNDTLVNSYFLQSYGSWKKPVLQYPYIQDVPYPKVILRLVKVVDKRKYGIVVLFTSKTHRLRRNRITEINPPKSLTLISAFI